ncbi:MAG: helix-turn-helix domain-containing protein [Pseudomonas proteolytica]|uniref:helix-turn-helix domain-containing protein n=1 Tax=Pseudomonas proteolytica TaxID=219574 RepID=UPI003F4108F8
MMAKKKIHSNQLAEAIRMKEANLPLLKNGKIKGFKLETLNTLCIALDCQPGDLLEFKSEET